MFNIEKWNDATGFSEMRPKRIDELSAEIFIWLLKQLF